MYRQVIDLRRADAIPEAVEETAEPIPVVIPNDVHQVFGYYQKIYEHKNNEKEVEEEEEEEEEHRTWLPANSRNLDSQVRKKIFLSINLIITMMKTTIKK
jgi:uncharacterized membrane protein YkgB